MRTSDISADPVVAALDALRWSVEALRKEVRELRPRDDDPRLHAFLQAVHGWSRAQEWTIADLLSEARQARELDVLEAIDAIVGESIEPPKSLGSWLRSRVDVECGGLRLERLRPDEGTWIYRVVSVELNP